MSHERSIPKPLLRDPNALVNQEQVAEYLSVSREEQHEAPENRMIPFRKRGRSIQYDVAVVRFRCEDFRQVKVRLVEVFQWWRSLACVQKPKARSVIALLLLLPVALQGQVDQGPCDTCWKNYTYLNDFIIGGHNVPIYEVEQELQLIIPHSDKTTERSGGEKFVPITKSTDKAR
ncbi:MAG: hypothetical protein J4G05_09910 [Chlorobi bacterium]|nr:hypothetical protein [Chlorobiota bacterium]